MKIKILVENTNNEKNQYEFEHGLSILIESKGEKILFDFGKTDKFMKNAERLGESLEDVTYGVLSHGHYDHGDGLPYFMGKNKNCPIYLQMNALLPYFSRKAERSILFEDMSYIGLEPKIRKMPYVKRFHFVDRMKRINNRMILYSGFQQKKFVPSINESLYQVKEDGFIQDDFVHELALLIEEDGKYYLFAGCAHNGIVNIVEQVEKWEGITVDVVFAGFHLHTEKKGNQVSKDEVEQLGDYLKTMHPVFYTGHCTGKEEYQQLKEILGEKLHYMSTGSVFEF